MLLKYSSSQFNSVSSICNIFRISIICYWNIQSVNMNLVLHCQVCTETRCFKFVFRSLEMYIEIKIQVFINVYATQNLAYHEEFSWNQANLNRETKYWKECYLHHILEIQRFREQRLFSGKVLFFPYQVVRDSNPWLAMTIIEIWYPLLASRDMTEIYNQSCQKDNIARQWQPNENSNNK